MSIPAKVIVALLVMATVVLEVVTYFAYRNTVDGQAVLVNMVLAIFAAVAISFVYAGDQAIKQYREHRRSRFAKRNAKPS